MFIVSGCYFVRHFPESGNPPHRSLQTSLARSPHFDNLP
jgi:hypothetical protein